MYIVTLYTDVYMVFKEKLVETLGTFIRKRRQEIRRSMQDLANIVGVSYQTLSKWELDSSTPRNDKLSKLASALEVPHIELVKRVNKDLDISEDVQDARSTKAPDTQSVARTYDIETMGMCVAAVLEVFEKKGVAHNDKKIVALSKVLFHEVENQILKGEQVTIDTRLIYDLV